MVKSKDRIGSQAPSSNSKSSRDNIPRNFRTAEYSVLPTDLQFAFESEFCHEH